MKNINISFEFFPPKTPDGLVKLLQTAKELKKIDPDYFSVTFGAGGSTRQGTIDTVKNLLQTTQSTVAPHVSCIASTRDDLVAILKFYEEMGVKRIVALRGDLPSGIGNPGEFRYAYQLVELIKEIAGDRFHIAVACYPECHPQAADIFSDLSHFKRKIDAGANSAITQYFYNADAYFKFVEEARKIGVRAPIIPGIMPIINFSKLVNFSKNCGAEIPRWAFTRFEAYHDDLISIKKFGIELVSQLCEQLIAGGAPGLHFYTLNQADTSLAICQNLRLNQMENISS